MSEPTQSVGGPASDDEGAGTPIEAPPVAYLRVFAQKDLEERDWPVTEGESTVGRDAECGLCLEAKSLSRCHASFLVEDGGHFLKDLGSRNRTYRKNIPLRPHTYYELTNGCELVLADIRCQYFIGQLPEGEEGPAKGEGLAGGDYEQTQMYSFDVEDEGDGDGGETSSAGPMADQTVPVDSEGSTVGEEVGEGGAEGVDIEATQAYDFGADVEGGGCEGVMDCEPTVAYHVGDVNASEDEDSPASSPLLVGKPPSSPSPRSKASRKVCFGQTVLYGNDDSTTAGDGGGASGEVTPPNGAGTSASSKESSSREHKVKNSSETAASASKPGMKRVGFEQPVLSADPDEQTQPYTAGDAGSDGGSETDSGGQRGEGSAERGAEPMEVEPTVAYELAGNSDDTDATVEEEGDGGRGDVEPTVAYQLEDNPAEGSLPEDTTKAGVSTADSEETTDGGGEGRSKEPKGEGGSEDQTEPSAAEGGSEDQTEPSAAEEDGRGGGESGTRTVDKGRKEEPDSQSSDSDLNDTIPAAGGVGRHSRQKTLFGRQSSRGRRGGKGGRGRGRGRGRTARGGGSPVPEPRPSVGSKGTRRGRGKRRISSDDDFPDSEPGPSDVTEGTRRGKTATDGGSPVPEPGPSDTAEGSKRGRETKAKRSSRTVVVESATEPSSSEFAADDPPTTAAEQSEPSGEEPRDPSSGSRGRSRRGRSKQTRGTASKLEIESHKSTPATSEPAAPTSSAAEATTVSVPPTTTPVEELSDESPDISIPSGWSPVVGLSTPVKKEDLLVSPASSSTGSISTAGSQGSKGGRGGGRGKGRGGRGAGVSTPKKGRAAKPSVKSESTSTLRHKGTPEHPPSPPPRVLFTGVVDKEGERTLRQLGGELVHSVYECTHLITDKVRRTVKFLCCLSRGCHLVSTDWLDQCRSQRRLLPPEPFTIKDRPAERQHSFSLNRSLQSARLARVLSGYKVFLTPNVRPACKDMVDIIKCSGGEILSSLPHTPEEGVIIVTCESDMSMCSAAMEAGVPVHSTELILGGVLKQELDLHSHLMSCDPTNSSSTSASGSTRKRKDKEPASSQPASKRRKKG